MPRRRAVPHRSRAAKAAVALAVAVVISAAGTPPTSGSVERRSLASIACSLRRTWLVRTARGYDPGRSGEIQLLPKEPNVLGTGLPHAGPWEGLQRVPLFLYGRGHVAPVGVVDRPVTAAAIAPTLAELLRFRFRRGASEPLFEALPPRDERPAPPRLLVTMVWDAAGRNVLEEFPNAWPYLRSLIDKGAWYDRAHVGSSPSQTASIHGTIGTGTYPNEHGLVGHRLRIGNDVIAPWSEDPGYLTRPTLADLYDVAMDNRPVVGIVAALSIQLGMLGHGTMWGGGDRDVAVMRVRPDPTTLGKEADSWTLSRALAPFYRLPPYVNRVGGLARAADGLDRMDGQLDGDWRDNSIDQLRGGYDTPARIPFETRVVEEVIERERFGANHVPDLLFVNYKIVDYISHVWSMNSREMRDAVRMHDVWLRRFVSYLDRHVGAGNWALVLTGDHGATPSLEASGGFEISTPRVEDLLQQRFDPDGDGVRVIEHASHTQMFVNLREMREHGHSLTEISRAVMGLTKAATASPTATVAAKDADEAVFEAAYPSSLLHDLPCLLRSGGRSGEIGDPG